jgi:hypothetical protein
MKLRLTLCAFAIAPAIAFGAGPSLRIPVVAMACTTLLATSITGPVISPSAITFNSPNPDVTPTAGSSMANIQWMMSGNPSGNWSVTVQAASSSLANCPAIPVSAISAQCVSATASGTGNPDASCSGSAFSLSTTPQTIASGTRQGNTGAINLAIAFTFTDAWKYPASSSCSIQITYTIKAP